MKFSILIPVYNTGCDLLRKALNSIISNEFTDSEVIIYDDGSDETRYDKLIREFQDSLNIEYVRSDENKGTLYARCELIRRSTKDYIIFLDSDDELHYNKAKSVIENTITDNPGYVIYSFITKVKLNTYGELDPKFILKGFLNDEFVISPYLTNKVFNREFLQMATDRGNLFNVIDNYGERKLEGITLGDDTIITLSYLMYLNKVNIPKSIFHTDESWYIQKKSHTYVKSDYWESLNSLKSKYSKLSKLREFFKIINDYEDEDINELNSRNLNKISLRLSISKFTRCEKLYGLIDELVKDFGWDTVIDYFKSREYLTMHLAQYFTKLDNPKYDYIELVHAYTDNMGEHSNICDIYGNYSPQVIRDGKDSDDYVEDLIEESDDYDGYDDYYEDRYDYYN